MTKIPASFRDPSGFLFSSGRQLYRQVNRVYQEHYEHLIGSGLYDALVDLSLLVPHQEVDNISSSEPADCYKILKPELIPFVSYPFEWCFSQLKGAALATLKIQKIALEHGMSLKDGSAYNIQFAQGKTLLIDTLSFHKLREGEPWIAYRQFCQHFLAPLALMAYTDVRLNQLFRVFIDGVPLDLTSSLLPLRTRFRPSLLTHIHLHAKSQRHFSNKPAASPARHRIGLTALQGMIENLESSIKRLSWKGYSTEWANYYQEANYSSESFQHKRALVGQFLEQARPETVWDMGANIGLFSRIASDRGIHTVCFDIDPAAVEKNYLLSVYDEESLLLPLLLDLTNPSPAMGWQNTERSSLLERGPVDLVLALALVHHLAISNNLPFGKIAEFFKQICTWLIIEFVPKTDPQVQRLLTTREDIFTNYTREHFESVFQERFSLEASEEIKNTGRILYRMKNRLECDSAS